MNSRYRLVVFLVPLALSGCVGKALEQATESARKSVDQTRKSVDQLKTGELLRGLGQLYHNYHDTNRHGPESWEAAKSFARQSSGSSQSVDQLQQMDYTVAWGMRFPDVTVGLSNFVLAYPSDGPQNGGMVLLLDGSVRPMTAAELNTALQNQASIKPAAPAASGNGPAPGATGRASGDATPAYADASATDHISLGNGAIHRVWDHRVRAFR